MLCSRSYIPYSLPLRTGAHLWCLYCFHRCISYIAICLTQPRAMPCLCEWIFREAESGLGGKETKCQKCAQRRNFAQGEALPKRDIVDTTFHALCATRHSHSLQHILPTVWGGTRKSQGLFGLLWDNTRKWYTCPCLYSCPQWDLDKSNCMHLRNQREHISVQPV